MEGKITKIFNDKSFFFVDREYWCHFNEYDSEPKEGDIVEYQRDVRSDGKKNAKNVKHVKNADSPLTEYFNFLKTGYFDKSSEGFYLRTELIVKYPLFLAEYFTKDSDKNKPSQIRKFFDQCKLIETKFKISRDFKSVVSELMQIIPLANNAKQKNHISDEFFQYLQLNINEGIKSEEDFKKGFIPHFQCLIGYFKTN